jgi:hypothetical protein
VTTEELKLATSATLRDAIDYLAINKATPAVPVDPSMATEELSDSEMVERVARAILRD